MGNTSTGFKTLTIAIVCFCFTMFVVGQGNKWDAALNQTFIYLAFGYILTVMFIYLVYVIQHKDVVHIISFENGLWKNRELGRLGETPAPYLKELVIKNSPFSRKFTVKLTLNYWECLLQFEDFLGHRHPLMVGKFQTTELPSKPRKILWFNAPIKQYEYSFTPTLPREKFEEFFSAASILEKVTNEVDTRLTDNIRKFESVSDATLQLNAKIHEFKNRVTLIMRRMSIGITDFFDLIQEVYGIGSDEIEQKVAFDLIQQKRQRDVDAIVNEMKSAGLVVTDANIANAVSSAIKSAKVSPQMQGVIDALKGQGMNVAKKEGG